LETKVVDRWTVREATTSPGDLAFLWQMLAEAHNWRGDAPRPSIGEIQANAKVSIYLRGWERPGDTGVIAEEQTEPAGAGWYRLFTEAEHGYAYIEPAIPELTLAVRPEHRGRGIGTALLTALVERAKTEGFRAIVLSVEEDNQALRLYERQGFTRINQIDNAWTMRCEL
jgi:ribosomal protein S18 acetylase RimI-like enzyme